MKDVADRAGVSKIAVSFALNDPTRQAAVDRALAAVLAERFPEPLAITHSVFVLTGRRP